MSQSFQEHLDRGSAGGVDFAVGIGNPIYAPTRGRVKNWTGSAAGNAVNFYHIDDAGNEDGFYDQFLHLSAFGPDGAIFEPGDDIGARSGNTGSSTGPHIHWDLRDPSGTVVRQWEYFTNTPPPKKKTEKSMYTVRQSTTGMIFSISTGYLHHISDPAEIKAVSAVLDMGYQTFADADLKKVFASFGIPWEKLAAVSGGKTWSKEQDILDAIAKIPGGGGGGYTPEQVAAAVDASLKDDFAGIPKAVNDDTARRMSS